MARYAIDAPTLVFIVERELACRRQLVAPSSIRSDALELLLRAGRSDADALELHRRMTELKLRALGDRVSRWTAWQLAREHGLELRAAEYLAVAKLQADAFVTIDKRFAKQAKAIVPLATIDALTISTGSITACVRSAARRSRRTRDRARR